LNIALLLAQA
jgi:hypothetical protein